MNPANHSVHAHLRCPTLNAGKSNNYQSRKRHDFITCTVNTYKCPHFRVHIIRIFMGFDSSLRWATRGYKKRLLFTHKDILFILHLPCYTGLGGSNTPNVSLLDRIHFGEC